MMSHRAEFEISVYKRLRISDRDSVFPPLAEVPTPAHPPRTFIGTSATVYTSTLRCRSHCQLAKLPSGGPMCLNNRRRSFFTPSSSRSRRRLKGSLCRRLAQIIIPMPRRTLLFLGRPTRIIMISTCSLRKPKHSPAAVINRLPPQAHLLHLPPSPLHLRLSLLSSSTSLLSKILYQRCKTSLQLSPWAV